MLQMNSQTKRLLSLLALSVALPSAADALTIGISPRIASATSDQGTITVGGTGPGNPQAADVASAVGGGPWSRVGDVNVGNGLSNGFLTITLTSGSFGTAPAAGTWSIDPTFWSNYSAGAISIHIGNGGGDPDHFVWLLPTSATSGTWDVPNAVNGFSNMMLWGSGTGVPDGGATLTMFGLALLGMGGVMKLGKKRS